MLERTRSHIRGIAQKVSIYAMASVATLGVLCVIPLAVVATVVAEAHRLVIIRCGPWPLPNLEDWQPSALPAPADWVASPAPGQPIPEFRAENQSESSEGSSDLFFGCGGPPRWTGDCWGRRAATIAGKALELAARDGVLHARAVGDHPAARPETLASSTAAWQFRIEPEVALCDFR